MAPDIPNEAVEAAGIAAMGGHWLLQGHEEREKRRAMFRRAIAAALEAMADLNDEVPS